MDPIRNHKAIERIKAMLAEKPRDLALFVFAINTGFRAKDLIGLTWEKLLTDEGSIKGVIPVVESKTKKERRLPVAENARKALNRLLKERGAANGAKESDYVFPSRTGRALTVQRLHQLVNGWTKAAGVEGYFGSHTLRKTFGYHLYKAGMDIAQLMHTFGHSSPSVTLRYIGIMQEDINQRIITLNL